MQVRLSYRIAVAVLSRSETRSRAVNSGLPRDQRRRWDHLGVLLSLFYRLLRCLSGLLAVLARSDLSKDAELLVLRHENQVLRRQLTGRLQLEIVAAFLAGDPAAHRYIPG